MTPLGLSRFRLLEWNQGAMTHCSGWDPVEVATPEMLEQILHDLWSVDHDGVPLRNPSTYEGVAVALPGDEHICDRVVAFGVLPMDSHGHKVDYLCVKEGQREDDWAWGLMACLWAHRQRNGPVTVAPSLYANEIKTGLWEVLRQENVPPTMVSVVVVST